MSKLNYPKVQIELRPSEFLKGHIGVFAVRDIKIGTVIGDLRFLEEGPRITWEEFREMDIHTQNKVDYFCLGTDTGFTAPKDFNYMSIPWYINHSCDPNVGFDEKGNFIVIKETPMGAELVYDYGTAEANPRFRMTCLCNTPKCRKIITGNDWKNQEFSKEKISFMEPSLRK